jgi:hypothetical protein
MTRAVRLSLIRFAGHRAKGGYDVQNGIIDEEARADDGASSGLASERLFLTAQEPFAECVAGSDFLRWVE